MKVKEIMTKDVIMVKPELNIKTLAQLFVEKDISGAPVVDNSGHLLGLVLEEGLIVHDKKIHLPTFIFLMSGFITLGEKKFEEEMKKIAANTVAEIMEKNAATTTPETEVDDIATTMIEHNKHYFVVIENSKIAGVVTKKDIVKAIAKGKLI